MYQKNVPYNFQQSYGRNDLIKVTKRCISLTPECKVKSINNKSFVTPCDKINKLNQTQFVNKLTPALNNTFTTHNNLDTSNIFIDKLPNIKNPYEKDSSNTDSKNNFSKNNKLWNKSSRDNISQKSTFRNPARKLSIKKKSIFNTLTMNQNKYKLCEPYGSSVPKSPLLKRTNNIVSNCKIQKNIIE